MLANTELRDPLITVKYFKKDDTQNSALTIPFVRTFEN